VFPSRYPSTFGNPKLQKQYWAEAWKYIPWLFSEAGLGVMKKEATANELQEQMAQGVELEEATRRADEKGDEATWGLNPLACVLQCI
jgi:hypothetical protein